MKRTAWTALVSCWLVVSGCSGGEELGFRPGAASPIARFESASAVVGERFYLMGGHAGSDLATTDEVYSYSPGSDQWTRHADLPAPVSHVNAVVEDGRFIWIAGGYQGDHPGRAVADVYRYDTTEDRWERIGELPAPRASGGLALVGDTLHYFGGLGEDRFTNYADHWALSLSELPGAEWQPRAPALRPRGHFGTAVLDGQIYVVGGHKHHDDAPDDGDYDYSDQPWVDRYDPAADAWVEVASLPDGRSHTDPGTFAHSGRIWIVGGRDNAPGWFTRIARRFDTRIRGLDDISAYRPEGEAWSSVGRLPHELYAPAAGVVGNELVVVGGGRDGWREPSAETWISRIPSP